MTASDTTPLLRGVLEGLRARRTQATPGGDGDLLAELAAWREAARAQVSPLDPDLVPPRRVGASLALALYSQPHLSTTFAEYRSDGTEEVREPEPPAASSPLLPSSDVLEACFGLPQWELDDLRDEVDRRAGRVLKQLRAVAWMWSRFRLPQAGVELLLRALFPGVTAPGRVGFVRRGAQLYVLCEQSPPAEESALFLPWSAQAPLVFDARRVDPALREELGRGIGANDEEICDLLGTMVTVVPRSDAIRWLVHDGWRSRGFAALSGLGARYAAAPWLTRPVAPEDLDPGRWLTTNYGRLIAGDADGAFFLIARQRVEVAVRHIYAELLARVAAEPTTEEALPVREDLDLYDAERWLRRVLEPVVGWAYNPDTRARLAARYGVADDQISRTLDDVGARWTRAVETQWCGPLTTGGPSVAVALTAHLIQLHGSLRRVLRVAADPRADHREAVLMFAAHDLGEARLDRLWTNGWADVWSPRAITPSVDDAVGASFWGAWQRLLTHQALDGNSTLF